MSEKKEQNAAKDKLRDSSRPVRVEPSDGCDASGEMLVVGEQDGNVSSVEVESLEICTMATASLEAEIQSVEASFAKELTDKMSHATMPGARDLAGFVGESGAERQAQLEELAKVVGDPHAEEHHWYSAAEAAGGKDLSGAPSLAKIIMFRTAVVLGVVLSFFSIMACYVSSVFFASDVGWLGFKLHNNMFLNDLVGLDYMGFLLGGAGALFFWSSFFKFWKQSIRYIAVALFMGVSYLAINVHFQLPVWQNMLFAAAYLPFLYLLGWIGSETREALPLHIGSKKLASVLLPAVSFPGIAMVATFWIISQPGYSQATNYAPGTFEELAFNACAIFLSTLIPGFVLARSINAKSPSGAATLATLLQAPLILGLLLTSLTCVVLSWVQQHGPFTMAFMEFVSHMGGGDWITWGSTKALTLVAACLLAGLSAAAGGALGAWCNVNWGDKTDEKPVEMG